MGLFTRLKAWLDGWERIKELPSWAEKRFYKSFNKNYHRGNGIPYSKTYNIKGKNYRYRVVVGRPKFQGDMPTLYYKRKRQKKYKKQKMSYGTLGKKSLGRGYSKEQYRSHGYKLTHGG